MFLNPGNLWLLLVIPALVLAFMRGRVTLNRWGRALLPVLRILAVALVVAALARPASWIGQGPAPRKLLVLADGSLSISTAELERAKRLSDKAFQVAQSSGVNPRALLFARRAFPLERGLEEWDRIASSKEFMECRDGTDIDLALTEARNQVDTGATARAILFTDGSSTAGNLEQGIKRMRRAGIPVHPVPLVPLSEPGVLITALEAPERAFIGDTLELAVRIESSTAGQCRLLVERDERPIFNEPVAVVRGPNLVLVRSVEKHRGLVRFRAQLIPGTVEDKVEEDNEAFALCQVQTMPKVLVVTDDPRPDEPFLAALKAQSVTCEVIRPAVFPPLTTLQSYSALVLNNVEARQLPRSSLGDVERFVKESGGGFLMLGGKKSFAAGGYAGTPVERALPVDMPTKSLAVSTAVVLLLDCSSSMSGYPVAQVKLSAKALLRMLRGCMVAVFAFSYGSVEVVPIQLVSDDYTQVDDLINRIYSGGGTAFQPPLKEALRVLSGVTVKNKHVIMLTDGEPSDEYGLLDLIDFLKEQGMKVSTVGIGNRVNPVLLKAMADRGGGRFHQPTTLSDLTDTFRAEASHIVEGVPILDESFKPQIVRAHPLLRGFTPGDFPTLKGYVGTSIKERAELVLSSHLSDPIVAIWRYGLGVSAAFTADSAGPWSAEWVTWSGYPRFFGQLLKATFRGNDSDYSIRAQIRGQSGEISIDAIDRDGAYINFLTLFAQVQEPDGRTMRRVELPQREPGRYQGKFPASRRGFYRIQAFRKDRDSSIGTAGAVASISPEFLRRQLDSGALERIASETGGTVLRDESQIAATVSEIPVRTLGRIRDWWPPFVALALVLFFAEVCARRGGVFRDDGDAGSAEGGALVIAVAEKYLTMAKDFDERGDHAVAQEYYLKARSYFLKAQREDEAKRMWERYRLMEERRGGVLR